MLYVSYAFHYYSPNCDTIISTCLYSKTSGYFANVFRKTHLFLPVVALQCMSGSANCYIKISSDSALWCRVRLKHCWKREYIWAGTVLEICLSLTLLLIKLARITCSPVKVNFPVIQIIFLHINCNLMIIRVTTGFSTKIILYCHSAVGKWYHSKSVILLKMSFAN